MEDKAMGKSSAVRLGALVLLMTATMAFLFCCSSANDTMNTVSSASAKIVTCPTTTVAAVAISNFSFQPNSLSIAVNDIVKWSNNDSTAHTVTSGAPGALDAKFDSGNLVSNATVCVQFLSAGTYQYFCNIHPFMTGVVVVQ
jgi:plastocyanin